MKLTRNFTITTDEVGQIEPAGTEIKTYTDYVSFTVGVDKDHTAELRMDKETFDILQKPENTKDYLEEYSELVQAPMGVVQWFPGNHKETVVAKFKCNFVTNYESNSQISLSAVKDGSEENKSFAKYTSNGEVTMTIDKETEAYDYFEAGKEYYLTFESVE